MSVPDEIARLLRAKAEIKEAIEEKDVPVPSSKRLDDYDSYVRQIRGNGEAEWGKIYGDMSEQTDLKNALDAKYEKPSGGIPSTDIASGVIPDVSNFITKSVDDLVNYYLKDDTYTKTEVQNLINAVKQFTYEVVSSLPSASADTMHKIYLVPSEDPQTQNVKDEYITLDGGSEASPRYTWEQIGSTAIDLTGYVTESALNTALADYVLSSSITDVLRYSSQSLTTEQQTQARTNIGAGTYSEPSGGIPSSDMASAVQTSLGKADSAYQKPSDGIPSTDMTSAVQTSLGKADSAYQKPSEGIPSSDMASGVQTSLGKADSAYQKPSGGIPASDIASGVIPTVPTISTNITTDANSDNKTASPKAVKTFVEGKGYYTKPSGGIPASDIASGVIPTVPTISTDISADASSDAKTASPKAVKTFVEGKGYGTYSKPSGGIPASDIASGVIPTVPTISTSISDDATSDAKTASPKAVKTYVDGAIPTVPSSINDLSDVTTGTPSDGDVLTYDSTTGKWGAEAAQGGSSDAVLYTQQTLTDAQKIQARENQGLYAGTEEDLNVISWDGSTTGRDTYTFNGTTFYKVFNKPFHYTSLQSLTGTDSISHMVSRKSIFLYGGTGGTSERTNDDGMVFVKDHLGNPAAIIFNNEYDPDNDVTLNGVYLASTVRGLSYVNSATDVTKTIYNAYIPTAEFSDNKVDEITDSDSYPKFMYPNVNAVKSYVKPKTQNYLPNDGLLPDITYRLGTLTGSITISLAVPSDTSVTNLYHFTFTAGGTVPSITWPNLITHWLGNCIDPDNHVPAFEAGEYYEVMIDYSGAAICNKFEAIS